MNLGRVGAAFAFFFFLFNLLTSARQELETWQLCWTNTYKGGCITDGRMDGQIVLDLIWTDFRGYRHHPRVDLVYWLPFLPVSTKESQKETAAAH